MRALPLATPHNNLATSHGIRCVSANGRAAQPLYLPDANLLDHLEAYTALRGELTGSSGVGRFLQPWGAPTAAEAGAAGAARSSRDLCDLHSTSVAAQARPREAQTRDQHV